MKPGFGDTSLTPPRGHGRRTTSVALAVVGSFLLLVGWLAALSTAGAIMLGAGLLACLAAAAVAASWRAFSGRWLQCSAVYSFCRSYSPPYSRSPER